MNQQVVAGKVFVNMNHLADSLSSPYDLLVCAGWFRLQRGVILQISECLQYEQVVDSICDLNWGRLTPDQLSDVAVVYYYFSVQFRENLRITRQLYPDDESIATLEAGECNTDNLSPWPGVAQVGEKMDHDEFMRRLLALSPTDGYRRNYLNTVGEYYLKCIRGLEPEVRAMSIASYEDRGLEKVFKAILTCNQWNTALLRAFEHFLREHVRFDQDPEQGHGSLTRHLSPNDDVLPMWLAFKHILIEAAPALLV